MKRLSSIKELSFLIFYSSDVVLSSSLASALTQWVMTKDEAAASEDRRQGGDFFSCSHLACRCFAARPKRLGKLIFAAQAHEVAKVLLPACLIWTVV